MAVSSHDYEGRTVYIVTERAEFDDLVRKGQIVYFSEEVEFLEQLADAELQAFLFRAKLLLPNTRIYDVR